MLTKPDRLSGRLEICVDYNVNRSFSSLICLFFFVLRYYEMVSIILRKPPSFHATEYWYT